MPNTLCWNCDALTQHELVTYGTANREQDPNLPEGLIAAYGAYRCTSCFIYAVGITWVNAHEWYGTAADWLAKGVLHWQPSPGLSRSYADVPPQIAAAATEAFECHARDHYRAAILLSRSVIEATAKEKGIDNGTLAVKINEMADQGFIRPHIKDGADEIRDLGNEMAHGDFALPVTEEDSKLVVDLMEEILAEVFQSPAKVTKAKTAAAARKAQSQISP